MAARQHFKCAKIKYALCHTSCYLKTSAGKVVH
jgi:hypothetical protein